MRPFVVVTWAVLSLAVGSLAAQPADEQAQKTNNIRKLIDLTGGSKMMDEIFNSLAANFKDPKQVEVFQEFRKELGPSQIFDIMVPAYDKYLSAEDIKEMIRFYESPTGQKLLEVQPKMMADYMPRVRQFTQDVMARVMERMKQRGIR
jgi:hypothetical protein